MIRKGSKVKWKWGNGFGEGKVVETYEEETTQTIKGSKVTRKGENGNKALLIEQQDGDQVLKLESEVEKV
jgi:ribosomal protein L24